MGGISPELLAKIAGAKASQGGNIIRDGKYDLVVTSLKVEPGEGGVFWKPEFIVRKCEAVQDDVKPNAVGTTCHAICNFTTNKSAAGNAKALVLAILGFTEDQVSNEEFSKALAEAVSDAQPLRGMLVRAETYRRKIEKGKHSGEMGVYPKWIHIPMTPDEITASRKMLDTESK